MQQLATPSATSGGTGAPGTASRRRRIAAGLAFLAGTAGALEAQAEMARFLIDPEHFSILFSTGHLGYQQQLGLFLDGSGSFTFDETTNELADLVVEIEAASVFSNHRARDNHLRSGDFLDAENHPMIRFVMTEAEPASETTGTITGDLTLRGVTLPVTLDVQLNKIGAYPWGSNYVVGVSAETVINRSDFGSTYALEGEMVGDAVTLVFEIEAIRQN